MFLIFVRILRISLIFLGYPPRILGGITCRFQKEPPISNSIIIRKITDPMTIMIRDVELIAGCF
jgi:hypothetical protein